jgi:hypothetical protein
MPEELSGAAELARRIDNEFIQQVERYLSGRRSRIRGSFFFSRLTRVPLGVITTEPVEAVNETTGETTIRVNVKMFSGSEIPLSFRDENLGNDEEVRRASDAYRVELNRVHELIEQRDAANSDQTVSQRANTVDQSEDTHARRISTESADNWNLRIQSYEDIQRLAEGNFTHLRMDQNGVLYAASSGLITLTGVDPARSLVYANVSGNALVFTINDSSVSQENLNLTNYNLLQNALYVDSVIRRAQLLIPSDMIEFRSFQGSIQMRITSRENIAVNDVWKSILTLPSSPEAWHSIDNHMIFSMRDSIENQWGLVTCYDSRMVSAETRIRYNEVLRRVVPSNATSSYLTSSECLPGSLLFDGYAGAGWMVKLTDETWWGVPNPFLIDSYGNTVSRETLPPNTAIPSGSPIVQGTNEEIADMKARIAHLEAALSEYLVEKQQIAKEDRKIHV